MRTARVLAGKMMASPDLQRDPQSNPTRRCDRRMPVATRTMLGGLLDYAQARDLSSSGDTATKLSRTLIDEIRAAWTLISAMPARRFE